MGFSTAAIGTILALHSAASMLVRPLIGVGIERLGYPPLLLGGILLAAAGLGVVPLFRTFLPLAFAAGLVRVAQGLTQPLTISLLTGAVEDHMRGVALGLRLSAMRLASFTSPLAFGFAVTAWGLSWAFYLATLVLVATVSGLVRSTRAMLTPDRW
ncbi:MAG: MFS transporter [Armatimonadota bacterium]|nr:MFS transporter [Armatimonadota bacterium]